MEMETINQKLKYKRERSSYNFAWNLACDERGENLLLDYSRFTERNLLSSGPMFCKTGCFQGKEKCFEFFTCIKENTMQIFLRMVRPAKEQTLSCGETFEITSASVSTNTRMVNLNRSYHIHIKEKEWNEASFVPSDITDDEDPSKWTVTWMKATFPDNSKLPMIAVNCLKFKVEVQHNTWGEDCISTHHRPDAEFTVDESKFNFTDQLSTSPFLFSTNSSDVTVYCEDKKYPAHTLILAGKSRVLAAMFTHPMQENINGELKIGDSSPEIVEEFLRFIYTGSVKNLEQNAAGLSLIAEKYDLPGLKGKSLNYLVRTISIENVLERYSLGKLLSSEGMVKKCIATMKTNKKSIWKTQKDFFEVCQELPELFDMLFV